MDRNRPLIGITAYEIPASFGQWRDMPVVMVPATYTHAVVRAGGAPVLVPPNEHGGRVLDAIDGIVFTGGSDIDPELYGQPAHAETIGLVRHRDDAEFALMGAALDHDLPMLAICRGMQVLNVVRGGDLHQHLADISDAAADHRGEPGRFAEHQVSVEPGSVLQQMVGDTVHTHSYHHQAPDRIGAGLRVSARSADGTVEAIEDPSAGFAVGVLWHPEESAEGGAPLFEELVRRAASRLRP